jgi:hypothetical protein
MTKDRTVDAVGGDGVHRQGAYLAHSCLWFGSQLEYFP